MVSQHMETKLHEIRPVWEAVNASSVFTSREVYDEMFRSQEYYDITYSRVPVTPLGSFDDVDLDHLVRAFVSPLKHKSSPLEWSYIFNCQMGQGRSTLGTCAMALLWMHQAGSFEDFSASVSSTPGSPVDESLLPYKRGEYPIILRLLRILDNGYKAKSNVDLAIQLCGQVFNLLDHIFVSVVEMETTRDAEGRRLAASKAQNGLQRYIQLICFAAYLLDCSSDWDKNPTFNSFMKNNLALRQFQQDLVATSTSDFVSFFRTESTAKSSIRRLRKGSVLQGNTILKSSYFIPESILENFSIPGAPNYRMISGLCIGALAQPSYDGIRHVLDDNLSKACKRLTWINFQVDPVLFINEEPFLLRDEIRPFQCLPEFNLGLTKERLRQILRRLKSDVLQEIHDHSGRLILHRETVTQELSYELVSVGEDNVLTPEEVFDKMSSLYPVQYFHIPVLADDVPSLISFDDIYEVLSTRLGTDCGVVFNCQMGRGRSTLGMVLSLLILYHQKKIGIEKEFQNRVPHAAGFESGLAKDISIDNPSLRGEFRGILGLIRILKKGKVVKSEVDMAIDICGEPHNLRHAIAQAYLKWETERSGNVEDGEYLKQCMNYFTRYAYIICFNSYLHDVYKGKLSSFIPFSSWFEKRSEILTHLDSCSKNPIPALKLYSPAASENSEVFESRHGNVLVRFSILKCDYFPGCQNKKLSPAIEGAPNYRAIDVFGVAGTAIPTESGIRNVIQEVRSKIGTSRRIFWTNLREEPLLYINNRPFCLRDVDDPYNNLVYTGIVSRRVEAMERQLKIDILEEAQRYGGKILLHDETDDGKLAAIWEDVTPRTVLTCREVYLSGLGSGADECYSRIPVTDEQAPLPETFDDMVELLKKCPPSENPGFFLYNCQMGRGRTTTGIVICCLWILQTRKESALERFRQVDIKSDKDTIKRVQVLTGPDSKGSISAEATEEEYLNGQYKAIIRLTRLIPQGILVKAEVDSVLDFCSHMQNLRTAIYNLKLGIPPGGGSKDMKFHRAVNYLIRYFYLIAFNAYLVEMRRDGTTSTTFVAWMSERSEITNILNDLNLD
jgi:protein-tyrosine phosphatase